MAASQATGVTVTAGTPSEFRFTLSEKSVAKGVVTFTVTNKGKLTHDFLGGMKTALLKPGKKATLRVVLKAGKAPRTSARCPVTRPVA